MDIPNYGECQAKPALSEAKGANWGWGNIYVSSLRNYYGVVCQFNYNWPTIRKKVTPTKREHLRVSVKTLMAPMTPVLMPVLTQTGVVYGGVCVEAT